MKILIRLSKLYLLSQVFVFGFFLISALPGRGRPWANGHPEVRGGGDKGFGGLDFYESNGDGSEG